MKLNYLYKKAIFLLELIFALVIFSILLTLAEEQFGRYYLIKKQSEKIINYLDEAGTHLLTKAIAENTFKLCKNENMTNPCLIENLGVKTSYKLPLKNCIYREDNYAIICELSLSDTLDLEAIMKAMKEFPFNTKIVNGKYFYFYLRF